MRLPVIPNLSCGECTVCCTALHVRELEKPAFVPCPHVTTEGCSIYAERPAGCRKWDCLWRMGFLGKNESRRPDQSGYIFDIVKLDGKVILVVYHMGREDSEKLHFLSDIILRSLPGINETAHITPDMGRELAEA